MRYAVLVQADHPSVAGNGVSDLVQRLVGVSQKRPVLGRIGLSFRGLPVPRYRVLPPPELECGTPEHGHRIGVGGVKLKRDLGAVLCSAMLLQRRGLRPHRREQLGELRLHLVDTGHAVVQDGYLPLESGERLVLPARTDELLDLLELLVGLVQELLLLVEQRIEYSQTFLTRVQLT